MLRSQFDDLIGQILDQFPGLSDIICTVGKPVQAEVHGELRDTRLDPDPGRLVPWHVECMTNCLLSGNMRLYQDLVNRGSCDLSYELRGRARFRVNVFQQKGSLALVMRQLPSSIPSLADLNLPDVFQDMAREKYGMILVTGGTGTGKSTSLAALVDAINAQSSKHLLTLEDPIEFVHPHKQGVINQREFGIDFDSFASGLRAALRQAPKVILVGEIRDKETIGIALEAAETGHLVLGALHTSDTSQTINRIIGMFELSEERLIRGRLAESLKYVVSQRLMPKQGGGRVAAFEVLVNTIRIRELIVNGEDQEKTFASVLQAGSTYKMISFDQYLADLFEKELISEEIAMLNGSDKASLAQMIDKIKAERGEKVTDIEGLELDVDYDRTE
ncbi:MAG: PilT/PilU family type 4a pilus ATPase [Desulfohalobiaceae bacterium]|nr:PilT/PilU family type 4a pilus ATPase [Desulfohalobiaceae bacterium]